MDRINQPSKEEVREWLKQRQTTHVPPPTSEQIRSALGWKLAEKTREQDSQPTAIPIDFVKDWN